jgi:hypothetical protein
MVPKMYIGPLGTNGWLMDFSNLADIGNDGSGNNNDLIVTGFTSSDAWPEVVFY